MQLTFQRIMKVTSRIRTWLTTLTVISGAIALTNAAASDFVQLDLRPFYNRPAESWPPGTSWGGLPHGQLEFSGVPFDVEGVFQLTGMTSLRDDDYHVQRVVIPAGHKAGWIHLLHGMEHVGRNGEPLWEVVLHYADGGKASFAIGYATHVYDWWERPFDRMRIPSDPNFAKVWNGSTSETAQHDVSLRLFRGSLKNPHPEKVIESIETHTLYGRCSPFIMGLTMGPAHEGARPDEPFQSANLNQVPRLADAHVTVKDAEGRPVANAALFAQVNWENGDARYGSHVTDGEGRVAIEYLPDQMNALQLNVAAPGFAATRKMLALSRTDDSQTEIRLQPGRAIAGLIVDDQGQPVPGAVVSIQGLGADDVGQVIAFKLGEAKSDAEGRWKFESAPADLSDLMFAVKHPEFFPGEFMQSDDAEPASVSTDDLKQGTAKLVLQAGHELAGQVVDPAGNGVPDARVVVRWSEGIHGVRETTTAAGGEFSMKLFLSQVMDLTVIPKEGLAPASTTVDIHAETPRQTLKVAPGSIITGIVIDEDGSPATDVVVELGSWDGNKLIAWKSRTDAAGRFEWNGAPSTGDLRFNFVKPGFRPITNRPIPAGSKEIRIQFESSFILVGKVIDAETGEPVPDFRFIGGQSHGPDHVYWERHNVQPGINGTFLYTTDREQHGSQVKVLVESDTHWPEISGTFASTGRHTNVFKLRPGKGARGVVVAANESPVQGAQVALLEEYLQFNGRAFSGQGNIKTTGADGSFQFAPSLSTRIVALHGDTYGEVQFEPREAGQLELKLQPFGSIEGVAYAGRELLANAEIMVSDRRHQPGVAHLNYDFQRFKTQTDAEGRFRFDDVPPGERQLVRLIKMDERGWRHAHMEPVVVKPAGVVTVRFGGKGAVVIGQVIPDDPEREIAWSSGHHSMHTEFPQPKGGFKSQEEVIAWQQTEEYKAAQRKFRSQSIEFLEAGRFRVTEVEPGDYTLNFHFTQPVPGQSFGGETLGNLSHKVTITEAHTRPDAEPVDLGTLDLTLRKVVELGSPAPLFEISDFNGKPIKLADLRGKYVFLDFWATWCGPCIAELPHLKAAYAALKDNENFVMLSLSLDQEIENPREYAKANGMDWMHGFLGDWNQATLPNKYGVSGIPATFLIGPDGNIVAKNIRGASTLEQIKRHLK